MFVQARVIERFGLVFVSHNTNEKERVESMKTSFAEMFAPSHVTMVCECAMCRSFLLLSFLQERGEGRNQKVDGFRKHSTD